ncbi:DUF262 domain-containing protein, partial [Roseinatronobacter ekhonensis]|uniref:DUF262 domain-containing protein n=1 Tax=Roseinatronobacter ekhonensis TaxID=254356 RepID=UPI001FE33009
MKATDAKLLGFLESARQFVIPIYQRTYSWTERECRQLWDDIRRAGRNDHIPVHFLGSVVYIEESLSNTSSRAPLLVIDGQQRLEKRAKVGDALRGGISWRCSDAVNSQSRKGYATCQRLPSLNCP